VVRLLDVQHIGAAVMVNKINFPSVGYLKCIAADALMDQFSRFKAVTAKLKYVKRTPLGSGTAAFVISDFALEWKFALRGM
jgi:hypothetical protein